MQSMGEDEYRELVREAEVVARDRHGDKVLRCVDGTMIKLFRLKRPISTALVYPYAVRFRNAARALKARSIPTVDVLDVVRIRGEKRDMVRYQPLEGVTLREALENPGDAPGHLTRFAIFLAQLHEKGVYFRAIHLANVLVGPGGGFGLIDISETRFRKRPLSLGLRARNFRPLVRYEIDRGSLTAFGAHRFVDEYLAAAGLASERHSFVQRLRRVHPYYAEAF